VACRSTRPTFALRPMRRFARSTSSSLRAPSTWTSSGSSKGTSTQPKDPLDLGQIPTADELGAELERYLRGQRSDRDREREQERGPDRGAESAAGRGGDDDADDDVEFDGGPLMDWDPEIGGETDLGDEGTWATRRSTRSRSQSGDQGPRNDQVMRLQQAVRPVHGPVVLARRTPITMSTRNRIPTTASAFMRRFEEGLRTCLDFKSIATSTGSRAFRSSDPVTGPEGLLISGALLVWGAGVISGARLISDARFISGSWLINGTRLAGPCADDGYHRGRRARFRQVLQHR